MSSPVPDALVAPTLLALRDELRRQLVATVAGPTLRCMVAHSATPPIMDGCACESDENSPGAGQGDAWVRLVSLTPASSNAGVVLGNNCPTVWQASIEIGTYRCTPLPEEGEALPEDVVTRTALMLASDLAALLRTLTCCIDLQELAVLADSYTPIGSAGGCAGGALALTVELPYQPVRC